MSAPVLKISPDAILSVVRGPNRGVAYRLKGGTVKIGRSQENDIVLDDSKVSRWHLLIESRGNEFWISDKSESQKGFLANGAPARECQLHYGDKIQVGDTVMAFGPKSPPRELQTPHVSPSPATEKKQVIPLFFVLGALAFILAFFMTGDSKLKRKLDGAANEALLNEHIEQIDKINEVTQLEIIKRGKNTSQYTEAQSFYLQGFREFRESNYSRAIHNFETALTLYPEHPLAKRYLSRAKLKLNQEITSALERGERNFQAKRYSQAFGEYRSVVMLSGDLKGKNAQLAIKRMEAINLILMNSR